MKIGTTNEVNRDEWVRRVLAQIPNHWRLLDAGAGEQRYRKYCSHLHYVAQDFSQYNGRGNLKGLQTGRWNTDGVHIVSDITRIPESDSSFDAILCTEVLEHLPEPVAAIQEFSRLLKPKGWLIMTAPFCSLTHFAPYHFITGFNRYWYQYHLPANDFEIREIAENGNYFEYIGQELRRLSPMARPYARRYQASWLDRLAVYIVLRWLQQVGSVGDSSKDVLCYGFHVMATKH